jgi:alpha-amylase/alpha-mannosidase (GH57 family)
MEHYICIHAHFYQPARENPWLEAIEVQDSARPFHDWNERVSRECYAPNAAARILDESGRIVDIVNNYEKISFNFGPTLLAWMERHDPATYAAVLHADRESVKNFGGHGSAIAQAHSHTILPLASARDKKTQIHWGIVDFVHRFGRQPEGMWLPETAVDSDTLEVLAAEGIKFTILAPHQAKRIRRLGDEPWVEVSGARIDPSRPYAAKLPSGRTIAIFFYDGPISRAVAFERLLSTGARFVERLTSGFSHERSSAQLVHIATDGETYGHHHVHGDMALAWALDHIESKGLAKLTNYGQYLELHPPEWEVQIEEKTAWSCAHGVERWNSDCGCHTGGQTGWNQRWRTPLRKALDWLRDAILPLFLEHGKLLFIDPWKARDEYIRVIIDRSYSNVSAFLLDQCGRELTPAEEVRALKILEMQRHAQLMYTSCGWFFNEVSGIETVQVLRYAGRVLQLAREAFSVSLEESFLERLELAGSNVPDEKDGRWIYEHRVGPGMVDLIRVGGHFAISSLFERLPSRSRLYGFIVNRDDYKIFESGRSKLAVGRLTVTSEVTHETSVVSFGVLHIGDMSVLGGVRAYRGEDEYNALMDELSEPFTVGDYTTIARVLDNHFGTLTYSIQSLFRDEQRRVLDIIWKSTLTEAEAGLRQLYDRYIPLVQFHARLGIPLPKVLQLAAEWAINMHLRLSFEDPDVSRQQIESLLKQANVAGVPVDGQALAFSLSNTIDSLSEHLLKNPEDDVAIERLSHLLSLLHLVPFEVDLWKAQNSYYRLRETVMPELRERVIAGDRDSTNRVTALKALGQKLQFREE